MHNAVSILGLAYRRYEDPVAFGVGQSDRLTHLYMIGQTGTGKSTLLHNLAWQDARLSSPLFRHHLSQAYCLRKRRAENVIEI